MKYTHVYIITSVFIAYYLQFWQYSVRIINDVAEAKTSYVRYYVLVWNITSF